MHPSELSIADFSYHLPEEKIAFHPTGQRDESKLLVYKNSHIELDRFSDILSHLPSNGLMIFNDTRVLNARLHFQKSTGGKIEIFCLEPLHHGITPTVAGQADWLCMVGGAAKWKSGTLEKEIIVQGRKVILSAEQKGKNNDTFLISFRWQPEDFRFEEILLEAGATPLPPYIKREATPDDEERYQTVYAHHYGSVAAPTAGLHFTEKIMNELPKKNISTDFVTLHVSAGTFKPVDAAKMSDHKMHAEWINVKPETIQRLIDNDEPLIAVGTTSLRTIETLYWLGVKTILQPEEDCILGQWESYEKKFQDAAIDKKEALKALLARIGSHPLITSTELMIAPGYTFRLANALITNFHQPRSTLLLLVAAAAGSNWKKIYETALNNDFRFLSFGDSSLIYFADQG